MKNIVLLSVLTSTILMAGGYKIPEVSLNAVALGAANVAHSNGADAAYYNPANMAFMKEKRSVTSVTNDNGLDGEFSNSNVLLVSAGIEYKF